MNEDHQRRQTDRFPWRWLPLFGYGFLAVGLAATLGLMQSNNNDRANENAEARAQIVQTARETVFVMCESENSLRRTLNEILIRSSRVARDRQEEERLLAESRKISQIDCVERARRINQNGPPG
jgi:hypothetical protein